MSSSSAQITTRCSSCCSSTQKEKVSSHAVLLSTYRVYREDVVIFDCSMITSSSARRLPQQDPRITWSALATSPAKFGNCQLRRFIRTRRYPDGVCARSHYTESVPDMIDMSAPHADAAINTGTCRALHSSNSSYKLFIYKPRWVSLVAKMPHGEIVI